MSKKNGNQIKVSLLIDEALDPTLYQMIVSLNGRQRGELIRRMLNKVEVPSLEINQIEKPQAQLASEVSKQEKNVQQRSKASTKRNVEDGGGDELAFASMLKPV